MKTVVSFICSILIAGVGYGQGVEERLDKAVKTLEADDQMKAGLFGFYVIDQSTGQVVYDRNGGVGMAVASSQKVITSTASLELLGGNYRYKTDLGYDGNISAGALKGNIYLVGSGDPTLGSWRYDNTKEQVVLNKWIASIKKAGVKQVNGSIIAYNKSRESQTIPGGWIWDDIGNYYGAGVAALNWHENQYDIRLRSGNVTGDRTAIVSIVPKLYNVNLTNELTTGKPGSGDNAYIYLAPYSTAGFIRGTIPPGQNSFTISGSFPDPAVELTSIFSDELRKQGIQLASAVDVQLEDAALPKVTSLVTHLSPSLDSMNYWFLRKSINLYGEALVKTLGYEKKGVGTTEAGLSVIKSFWKSNGIDGTSINIIDGSGLSPQNRVTPAALAKVMQWAKTKQWFNSFYNALPEYNGLKMKSGTIGGTKSFTGYVGNYTFAIVVNNYNGSAGEIVKKMYKVLDVLK